MSLADEIERLQRLRADGVMTEDEFSTAKAKLLSSNEMQPPVFGSYQPPAAVSDKNARTWAMALHLSMLAGFVTAGLGLVAPLLIWLLKREEIPSIDEHGKEAANWIISAFIYSIVSGILCLVLIGFPLLLLLFVLGVVFPIIAAVKANEGILWRYPLTIRFIS